MTTELAAHSDKCRIECLLTHRQKRKAYGLKWDDRADPQQCAKQRRPLCDVRKSNTHSSQNQWDGIRVLRVGSVTWLRLAGWPLRQVKVQS